MTRIRIRRGTTAEWTAYNPILDDGEPGFDTALKVFKVGDGATPWTALPAQAGEPGVAGPGVPVGGTVGQALTKVSGTDYDTAWTDVATGGGSGTITSVNSQTGPTVVLTKTDLGLANVDNTADTAKPVSTATQTALNAKANSSALAAVALSGSASDITTGILPTSVIPPLPVGATFVVASQSAMLALAASVGDMAVRTDLNKTYRLGSAPASTLGNWIEIPAQGAVSSVASKTGNVTLVKGDVGLGSVDNTADTAKPVSTAQQTALNLKADLTYVNGLAVVGVSLDRATDAATGSKDTVLSAGVIEDILVVPLGSHLRIDVDYFFMFTGDPSDDMKMDLLGPSGATIFGRMSGPGTGAVGYTGAAINRYTYNAFNQVAIFGTLGTTTDLLTYVEGSVTIHTGATAGNLQFRYCRNSNTSGASGAGTAVKMRLGSNVRSAVQ